MTTLSFGALFLILLVSSISAHPLQKTLTSAKQISSSVFTCDSSDELLNAICQVGLRKINSELEAAGISIDRDGILFTFDDPVNRKIKTGHSCTITAEVKHQHVSARLSSSARLDVTGNSLTEPLGIRVQLPASLSARVDIKQRFGTRILGSCSNTGSDSYSLKASAATTADIVTGISLNPSLGVLDSGDYGLVIEPKVAVLSNLRNTNLKFRASGVSPVSGVLTFVIGFSSTIFKSVTALFKGDNVKSIIENALVFDFGVPILLGVGALPRPIEDAIWGQLLNIAEHKIQKKAKGFGPDLEDKLEGDLKRILKVGVDGKRVFIIKKDIINLLRLGGVDVFVTPPVDPSRECFERSRVVCSSPDLAVIYAQCVPLRRKCQEQQREHREKFTPSSVIPSRPKIASLPPVTTPPPPTRPPTTTTQISCTARPGQHIEC